MIPYEGRAPGGGIDSRAPVGHPWPVPRLSLPLVARQSIPSPDLIIQACAKKPVIPRLDRGIQLGSTFRTLLDTAVKPQYDNS